MNLIQTDGSSRERKKEVNMGKVWLPFLPCGLLLKTEKKHCSHGAQSEKILQKWVRSSYNKDCTMKNAFAFLICSFHLL